MDNSQKEIMLDAYNFWKNVNILSDEECWEWSSYIHKSTGYGEIRWNGRQYVAHRLAYLLSGGEIDDKAWIKRTCGNILCCNPKHLYSKDMLSSEDDFWGNCDSSGGEDSCWIWSGIIDKDGYGKIKYHNKMVRANRLAYEIYYKLKIPSGMLACHVCDTPSCVNPRHIFLGTPKDNSVDMSVKGRGAPQNGENNPCAKLTWNSVAEIRGLWKAGGLSQRRIGYMYGVSQSNVRRIINNEMWVES